MPYSMEHLVELLTQGDKDGAVRQATALRQQGVSAETIVQEGIEAAMLRMDAKCTMEDFNLLEIMLVGRAALEVMHTILPVTGEHPSSKGKVLLATPEGDVHDLGKNIVRMVLMARGYQVTDCGRDCPLVNIVSFAKESKMEFLGVSGLITSVIPIVRNLRSALKAGGVKDVMLIAGGAALKQASHEDLNVDFVAKDVFDGVRYMQSLRKSP